MIFAGLAALVAAVFSGLVLVRYARKRKPHEVLWGIGLALFAIANAAAFLAQTGGATETEYRVFYLFGGIMNVAWLATGTVALLAPRTVLRLSVAAVLALSAVGAYAVFGSPVDLTAAADTGKGFEHSPFPRVLAGIGSGIGSIVLIGGALWSGWVFLRKRHQGRRALANLLIAAGVLVAALGGTATFVGGSGLIGISNLIGITLMFAGFLLI